MLPPLGRMSGLHDGRLLRVTLLLSRSRQLTRLFLLRVGHAHFGDRRSAHVFAYLLVLGEAELG